jgi:7,8-dihydropterin-6-yl-methyl-4-(beta-D-ribofuranosyl)aminobenzene 5'-phosphate synthase
MIVLSHGHYDHTGGLLAVLQATGPATIVAHPGVLEAKYALQPGEEKVLSIGLPFTRSSLEKEGATFHLSQEPLAISPCIMTSGEVPLASSFEKVDHSLLVEKGGVINQDPMADDQALIINTSAGLVIILGCAHHGVINTLIHACNLTGVSKILAVIGGMHLYRASEEQVRATLATLKSMKVERLVSSHCTGSAAAELLAKELGERFSLNSTGSKFLWP